MENEINIKCKNCGTITKVDRTDEIPANVCQLGCNWCPKCNDNLHWEYVEWYVYGGKNHRKKGDKKKILKLF